MYEILDKECKHTSINLCMSYLVTIWNKRDMVPNDINHVYIWLETFVMKHDLDFLPMNPFFIATIIRQIALVLLSVSKNYSLDLTANHLFV